MLLSSPRFANATVEQITSQLKSMATKGALDPVTLGADSPNLLLRIPAAVASNGPSIGLTTRADGRLALFGVNTDGYVFYRNQQPGTEDWAGWTRSREKGCR